jgi:hypothetical protein
MVLPSLSFMVWRLILLCSVWAESATSNESTSNLQTKYPVVLRGANRQRGLDHQNLHGSSMSVKQTQFVWFAHACGWAGTVSGMLMTLAPSKFSMMGLGLLCSTFQVS